MTGRPSLCEFRLYVHDPSGEWTHIETFATRDEALEGIFVERAESPTCEFKLARRTTLEEWLDD